MIPSASRSRFRVTAWLRLAALLTLAAFTPCSRAQSTGSVNGTVTNRDTRAYLEGARVTLVELNRSALTARDGSFTIADVPAGSYTVRTYYTGFDDSVTRVEVAAGRAAPVAIGLTSEIYKLEKFEVSASQIGDAASITKQRNVQNVMNVVSTEAFGNVADGNIGNFLVRLPSISGDMENGEVTGVRVRGLPPHLNAVAVDGMRTASALGGFNSMGDRAAQIDHVPSEFVKEIELNKAPLPEHPVDSLGGGVNLVTKSAFDFEHDVLTYRAGINHNVLRSDLPQATPNFALTYLTRRGPQRNLGFALSLTYSDSVSPRNRVDMQRNEPDGRNTQARTLANANRRWRKGAGFKFDYRLDAATTMYLKFQHNYFLTIRPRTEFAATATGNRLVADYNVVSRAQIEAGAVPRTTAGVAAGVAPGFTDSYTELLNAGFRHAVTSESAPRVWQYIYELGATRTLAGDQKLSVQATYNPSTAATRNDALTATFTRPIGMAIDTTKDPRQPRYRQTYGPTVGYGSDMSLYTATYYRLLEKADDDMTNLKADYEKAFRSLPRPVKLKAGVHWREQKKFGGGAGGVENYSIIGADGVAGRNAATGQNDDNLAQFLKASPVFPVEVQGSEPWPAMNDLDYMTASRLFDARPEWFRLLAPATPVLNTIKERIGAAYVQGTVQFGKLNVLGGVRFEQTDVVASGRVNDPRRPGLPFTTKSGDYQDFFPSVHLRYDLRPGVVARASYSTGMARPNMSDLVPVTTVSYAGDYGTVTQNNPGLKPQRSENVDLSLEYYFEPAGVFSVGWFHKDITDFISRTLSDIGTGPNNGFNGQYELFTLNTTTNLGAATVKGWEVNYSQTLTMLPKPFNGLGLYANYTYLKTAGTYANGVSELDGFVPRTANLGVSYRWRSFHTRVSYNYTGDFLRSRNNNINQQLRFRPKTVVDVNFQYQYRPQLSFFVDLVNIGDSWPVWYTGTDRNRVRIADSYGARVNVGFSGRF
jgi:iron complex outermembrane receptor protein